MDAKYKPLRLTDEEIADVKAMRDHFWKEDTATRQQLLAKWRRLKFFWDNITNVWYDSVAHDWRIWPSQNLDGEGDTSDQAYYDQRINVFRAYLESIIAALSVTVPPVKAYPDNAENALDLETAKAADKIAALIFRHNDAPLYFLHALFVYCTEGMICGYNYAKHDTSFGTYKVDEYEDEYIKHLLTTCGSCGYEIDDQILEDEQVPVAQQLVQQSQQMQQQPMDPNVNPGVMNGMDICPHCNQPMIPQMEMVVEVNPKLIGTTNEPKGRTILEAYGGLNCKYPLYARKASEVLYNFYCYETHFANAIELFPNIAEDIRGQFGSNNQNAFDSYEQWARLSTEYRGEYPINCVTIKQVWFRCAAYNILDKDRAAHWKKKYPNGIRAAFVNDYYAACYEESMDEHWTFSYNPLSDHLGHDPLGMLLTSVQEITNDLIALTKQTIEHGVGLTFVDPGVVDLNAYAQTEVVPGALIPTKPISGAKKISDGFFEVKTATLSSEVAPFGQAVQSLGQLASGAQPAIFGGQLEGSDTASEYSMSKNQATTRLGIHWKLICTWWKNVMGKAIPMYMQLIQCDEHDVQRREDGSFVNIVVKKSELSGKIGKVELEASENLPLTWSQRKDIMMQIIQSPNPQLMQMIMQPENLPILRESIGLDNFYVPGADDVDKQWAEIQMLIESEPIQTGNPEESQEIQGPMQSSVEIDVLMDTHPIHFEICRKWAISEIGQYYKYNKPAQYQNVLLHAKEHLDAQNAGMEQQQMNQAQTQANGANPEKPKELNGQTAPITGEKDVKTAV